MLPERWEPYTDQELLALVRSYTEQRLRENYAAAAKHPGTDWHRRLLAELRRRGLKP